MVMMARLATCNSRLTDGLREGGKMKALDWYFLSLIRTTNFAHVEVRRTGISASIAC
jgi:hypothetical protein